jgi:predicted amidohydrolase
MPFWKIAAVQMDVRLADPSHNLGAIIAQLRQTARAGARLTIFPECALPGYCYESKAEAWPHAEPIPGPSTVALAAECQHLGTWAVVGMLETSGADLFNTAVLVGPRGTLETYRKIHLPCLGVDRFTTPGNRPFTVHDLGGLRLGLNICYDASFPEAARCLMLLGADLVALPTNWPPGAASTVKYLIQARALENRIYFAAVDRIGTERGFPFIGQSRIVDVNGEFLAVTETAEATVLYADIDPQRARDKRIINVPGQHEVHRTRDRRPEMYADITNSTNEKLGSVGHSSGSRPGDRP